jgi:hypothetical protein
VGNFSKPECTERYVVQPYGSVHALTCGISLATHDAASISKKTTSGSDHVNDSQTTGSLEILHDVVFPLSTGTSCPETVANHPNHLTFLH